MNALERWAMKDDLAASFSFIGIAVVSVIVITVNWANPGPDSTLTDQIILTVVVSLFAFMFGTAGLSGLHSAGVVKGANGWDDGYDRQQFNKKIAERRQKLEAKLQ